MRFRNSLLAVLGLCFAAHAQPVSASPFHGSSFHVIGSDPGSWPTLLSSIGLINSPLDDARVIAIPNASTAIADQWIARVDRGTILILEGESHLATAFGFRPTEAHQLVRSVEDLRAPKLRIIWETALDLPAFEIPKDARIFARERPSHEKSPGMPLLAGFRRGAGAVLWLAAPPGSRGYERFPYILQALADLGLEAPSRSARLWAFFDSAYRSRADPDYLAVKWRAAGISALHVAAWHDWERDPQGDEYLRQLIEACHRHAILVYAWLELPHVSEKFWDDHPEWREKTALLEDAHLDWRKLMNLTNRAAARAVASGLRDLLNRFDWDGVNLAELYFESLEGDQNSARFTPMNSDVRDNLAGFDPLQLFDPQSPLHFSKNPAGIARFLEFRTGLAQRLQVEWIGEIEAIRRTKSDLDLVLTHVDDRFDPTMRDKIGADASRVLPLLDQHDFTFLIEDPATIWNLGPERYPQIAARYKTLTPAQDRLAIDINLVERYQDVYPTKQQTAGNCLNWSTWPRLHFHAWPSISRTRFLPPTFPCWPPRPPRSPGWTKPAKR